MALWRSREKALPACLEIGAHRVQLRVNSQAKRLSLRIDKGRRAAIMTVPARTSQQRIQHFLRSQESWLDAQMAQLPALCRLRPGVRFSYQGALCEIVHGNGFSRTPVHEDGTIRLGGPADAVEARLIRWLKGKAREQIVDKSQACAQRLGVDIGRITIRDTKSRWGSCTADGNLNFNWRLILAPPDILDYVVAHEVAHRLEMNHSASFWRHVAVLCPDYKRHRQWLRRNGDSLLAVGPPRGG